MSLAIVSISASVSAGGNFVLGGDQTSSGSASFINAEKITITSAGDDSGRTFTITGTDKNGTSITDQVTGANAGAATSLKYFKTVTQISVDSGGNTAGAVTAGVINKEVKIPLILWDERLSTVAAEKALLQADITRKRRSEVIDHVAASYILQGALDRMSHNKSVK